MFRSIFFPVRRRIRRSILFGFACVAVSSCASPPAPATSEVSSPPLPVADLLRKADEHYARRENLDEVRDGIQVLRRVRALEPSNYDAAWRMARLTYRLGNNSTDRSEREAIFRDGIAAGEAAVRVQPNKPEGHFWLGANKGGNAQLQGPLSGLAAVKELRREMETVIRIDEGFQGGSAYMVLGRLDLEVPEMMGGDRQRAVEILEKGLRFGAENSLLRLRLAEAYLAVKRPTDARKQIDYILNMTPHPDFLVEYEESVTKARRLLSTKF
ncbi:MAG: TRAP transporter TatT component family protein [Acidobacteriota bacterium]|nr:TRAP transporter TatT component family protein [Acidobacteriota bacterium]